MDRTRSLDASDGDEHAAPPVPPILQMLGGYGNQGLQMGISGAEVASLVSDYRDLLDLLPQTKTTAIMEPIGSRTPGAAGVKSGQRRPLTHNVLHNFIAKEFDLTRFSIPWGTRVGVVLPNGPELAVCIIGTVSRWCAAPINPSNTWQEIKSELESSKAQVIIVQAGIPHESALYAAGALSLGVIEITPSDDVCGLFSFSSLSKVKTVFRPEPNLCSAAQTVEGFVRYNHPETVLLLHTSGTSGTKKLVPYSLDMLVIGVGCIISSWRLTPADVCLNMMPLFHIGGIVRNIFSPILSGGAVIASSGFDPVLFWDVLGSQHVTSYYAAPTMHHAILLEAKGRPKPLPTSTMRYIANAAGGLLPVLADALKATFPSAVILTSYGMTECMPIASPPQNYAMNPAGTSGTMVGPSCIIVDDDRQRVPPGQKGNILIRGPPCFGGYENNTSATDESFWVIDSGGDKKTEEKWFNTGDVGYLDAQGYLFISGRSKEIINRGGETISPLEIEEALIQHPLVLEALAFSAPHDEYQETVGAVIVSRPGQPRVDLLSLHRYLDDRLHRSKWPQVLIFMPALPKNTAGKILRIRLGERLRLKAVDEESPLTDRLWEVSKAVPPGATLSSPIDSFQIYPNTYITTEFIKSQFGIRDVVILSMDLHAHRGCFVACVTPSTIDIDELTKLCRLHLHHYLIPTYFCALDRFPISSAPKHDLNSASSHRHSRHVGNSNSNGHRSDQPESTQEKSIICSQYLSKLYENKTIDEKALLDQVAAVYASTNVIQPRDDLEAAIELIWRNYLVATAPSLSGGKGKGKAADCKQDPKELGISIMDNFFDLGGDSLKAGQLINALRKQLSIQGLTVPDLFSAPTISAIAKKIASLGYKLPNPLEDSKAAASDKARLLDEQEQGDDEALGFETHSVATSNSSFASLFVQAVPLVVLYPIRKMAVWFFIAQPWVMLMDLGVGRLRALVISMILARILTGFLFPLTAILAKWIIIGKYQPGRYPLFGGYYLRWWLVEQILRIFGKGYFAGNMPLFGNAMLILYYRMLGARIGQNVKLSKGAMLGQPDLVHIGDDVIVDDAIIRPFTLEERHMVLLPIRIGSHSSVGARSVLAAGSKLPKDTHIGPQSSSHEVNDASFSNRKYCRPLFSQPSIFLMLFLGFPIIALVTIVSYLPWYFVLRNMEDQARSGGWYKDDIRTLYDAFSWWCTPERLPYYFALRILRKVVVPPIQLLLAIFVKNVIIGKFVPCETVELERPWNRFRYWLMKALLNSSDLNGVAPLVGKHYEIISVIYRMLGSKVGKRVYWPGSGFDIVDYDLLEVGNDVVFGSRSVIMTRSSERAATVVIGDSAMLADRCVVLPGATLLKGSVLGTGALARENYHYPMGSVWVGSQQGNAVPVFPEDSSIKMRKLPSAFGKAFYERSASFFVFPLWLIMLYNTLWHIFCCCYHNMPPVAAIYIATYIGHVDRESWIMEVAKIILVYSMPVFFLFGITSLVIDIAAKWLILGRREPGVYPWDKSSYCQRWQVYLTIQDIRRADAGETGMLELLQGSQYIVWYFRALGCVIGKEVCLYPNGANPMMTEPELVTISNHAAIDDASLIGHVNTKGIFSLSTITVGENCVLKTGSRLMSGASMGNRGMLLEHTLILSGDAVSSRAVWQGWPSKVELPLKIHQRNLQRRLRDASMHTTDAVCSRHRFCCCLLPSLRANSSLADLPSYYTAERDSNSATVESSPLLPGGGKVV